MIDGSHRAQAFTRGQRLNCRVAERAVLAIVLGSTTLGSVRRTILCTPGKLARRDTLS